MLPVTILTGFLGAGKTTLLKRVLDEAHGQKIAVIENEFGEENVDHEILVSDAREQIVQMSNGCVCCSMRDDLRDTLQQLARRRRAGELDFDRVMIETTGLADPGPVVQTFFLDDGVAADFLIDSVITLVDARHAQRQLDERLEARREVGFADQIFISKADLAAPNELRALRRRLSRMNPRAPQRLVRFGAVPLAAVLDLRGFNLNARLELDSAFGVDEEQHHAGLLCADAAHDHPHHHRQDDDVASFAYRAKRAFDPDRLQHFLGSLLDAHGPRLYRYKGVLWMHGVDRKVVLQGVHQMMGTDLGPQWAADEARQSRMVFIGQDLPRETLVQGLDRCLI